LLQLLQCTNEDNDQILDCDLPHSTVQCLWKIMFSANPLCNQPADQRDKT
jgi:hypothetical protein